MVYIEKYIILKNAAVKQRKPIVYQLKIYFVSQ